MADILDDLADLHRQATHEPSHYYAAKTAEQAIREIERLRAAAEGLLEYHDKLKDSFDAGSWNNEPGETMRRALEQNAKEIKP